MGYKYLSPEWMEEAKNRINADPDIVAKGKDVSKRLRLIATDCPGDKDILFDMSFVEGKVGDVHREEKPSPSDLRQLPYDKDKYFLSMMPSYENTYKVTSGKFGILEAIKARQYNVQGSKLKIIAFYASKKRFFDAVINAMKEIPTDL